jgi:hypothetical protein
VIRQVWRITDAPVEQQALIPIAFLRGIVGIGVSVANILVLVLPDSYAAG